ncbi:DNA endonuclease SmrA [Allohahella sp. A8]|uniref:DNA endonuclease SmrA n=1 Tax=Allohahella sp. A8 TaxID=3141461 RepID=UPI000C0B9FF5|nr:DNA endonuclease SmrA [Hahellaceae bacterium]|tara:strand:- start:6899 stop:7489 length:591 start_codon:yes stop_codon:yes gene_type:complete
MSEKENFFAEMADVKPLEEPSQALVKKSAEITPGVIARRAAATRRQLLDQNHLRTDEVPLLKSNDVLSYKVTGLQNGVFRKLRLGHYLIEARLDLHRRTVEQARQEVWQFIRDCSKYELRTVMILHGKGDRNADQAATLKSYLNIWLPEFPQVLAFHSAQVQHGGTGSVYIMLRKSEREKQENRERFGGKAYPTGV